MIELKDLLVQAMVLASSSNIDPKLLPVRSLFPSMYFSYFVPLFVECVRSGKHVVYIGIRNCGYLGTGS